MRIEAAPDGAGPRFCVRDEGSGAEWHGATPTAPWTALCVALRLGTRISGPLFFGFSDPLTQRAIAQTYTAAELAAARGGRGAPPSAAPGADEVAAVEFEASLRGLGRATSLALARTRHFGGAPLGGVGALRAAARADGGARLAAWLRGDPEVGAATRRWPLWGAVFVPRIVAQLLVGDEGGDGGGDGAAGEAAEAGGGGVRRGGRERRRKRAADD